MKVEALKELYIPKGVNIEKGTVFETKEKGITEDAVKVLLDKKAIKQTK
jgi:hypothetical protein